MLINAIFKIFLFTKNLKIKIYKTIILPVVLYGCETWSVTLREESRLREFENRILRRIFPPKRDENGEWRRLHNEELNSLYCYSDRVGVIEVGGVFSQNVRRYECYRNFDR